MNGLEEIFRDKPQEIICMKLYYELGELDFKRLKRLATICPEFQSIVENCYPVHLNSHPTYYLVPVRMVIDANKKAS